LRLTLVGVQRTISSAKRPPQQCLSSIVTPSSSQLLKISLINKLKRIGDRGQLCRTSFFHYTERTRIFIIQFNFGFRRKVQNVNKVVIFSSNTKTVDFTQNVTNGNRIVSFFEVKKRKVGFLIIKFPPMTNFSKRNIKTYTLFFITKTKMFRSNETMFKSILRNSIGNYFS